MLQRFIGVQYVKKTERISHYSMVNDLANQCRMSKQYDFMIHIDKTNAVIPLKYVKASSVRPGTTDYSKWNAILADFEEID